MFTPFDKITMLWLIVSTAMAPQRVLVVEDDVEMRAFYRALFEGPPSGEFRCTLARDGGGAVEALSAEKVQMVVLDWCLPDLPGSAVLKAIRAQPRTRGLGVMVVTAGAAPEDAVLALESGADDYLAKPFDSRVFLARLRCLSRRMEGARAAKSKFELPGLSWDAESGRLLIDGIRVHLNRKESEVLRIFLERPDVIHPHFFLWERAWGYESDNWDRIVISLVSALRKKLGPKWGLRLEAQKGMGYVLRTR